MVKNQEMIDKRPRFVLSSVDIGKSLPRHFHRHIQPEIKIKELQFLEALYSVMVAGAGFEPTTFRL